MKNYLIITSIQCENNIDALHKARQVSKLLNEYVQIKDEYNRLTVEPDGNIISIKNDKTSIANLYQCEK